MQTFLGFGGGDVGIEFGGAGFVCVVYVFSWLVGCVLDCAM